MNLYTRLYKIYLYIVYESICIHLLQSKYVKICYVSTKMETDGNQWKLWKNNGNQ